MAKVVNQKGRREKGAFLSVPRGVIDSQEYTALSPKAVKLLFDLYAQYRGNNNGDLAMAWKLMAKRGWKSRDTLNKARKELLDSRFIIISRQGGRHKTSLFALTFLAVDECKGKLDISDTSTPLGYWKKDRLTRIQCQCDTHAVSMRQPGNVH